MMQLVYNDIKQIILVIRIYMNPIDPKEHLSNEYQVRVEKVQKLRELGIEPWPDKKEVTACCQQVLLEFKEEATPNTACRYKVSGRIMAIRLHGKAGFAIIQDETARLQVYIKSDIIGEQAFDVFKQLIDVGDIVWCEGYAFKTKMGEISLHVDQYTLLSKCLHPLPEKFHGIADIEIKYRQRYLDLIMSPETRQRFINRSHIIDTIRTYLNNLGYLEVETPMLHPIAGGAAARPFVTHHNALDTDFYLRIAPELYLKRLVIGGIDRVYEINRNFRNEGVSTRHNPEFTMVELYTANEDYVFSMNLVEDLLRTLAMKVNGTTQVQWGPLTLDFATFERISMKDSVIKYGKVSAEELEDAVINTTLAKHKIKLENKLASTGEKIFALFEELVEKHLIQPTFIIDFPIETSPLAKRDSSNPSIAPRYELFIAGMELSNSYNELNDPFDQAKRFQDQLKNYEAGDEEAHQYDAEYVRALEYGLPPTVGIGIGIDRLVMLLTNTATIKEVILFPALKKKED